MSWGINPNATEKEKIFAEFNDSINGLNCADGLSYRHYSAIYDLGRKLADDEYNQGRADERADKRSEIKNAKYAGYFGFDSWDCPTCGKDVTNKPNFCPNCGQKLKYERKNKY